MLAKKCDRCGAYFDHYGSTGERYPEPNSVKLVYRSADGAETSFERLLLNRRTIKTLKDLCPACLAALIHFLESGNLEALND